MTASKCPDCELFHVGRRPCDVPRLREAFRGVELTPEDDRFLRWVASWDCVDKLLSLVNRLREGPRVFGRLDRAVGDLEGFRDARSVMPTAVVLPAVACPYCGERLRQAATIVNGKGMLRASWACLECDGRDLLEGVER